MKKDKTRDNKKDFEYYINNPEYSLQLEKLFYYVANNAVQLDEYYTKNIYSKVGKDIMSQDVISSVFKFTNENFTELYEYIKSKNRKVLTVGSSGDQALIAILNGTKNITIADLNMYTKMWTELKIAGIKNLNFEEFCNYFACSSREFFHKEHKTYAKISHSLPSDVQNFWDTMMIDGSEEEILELFEDIIVDPKHIPYIANEENYLQLQNALKKNDYKIKYIVDELSNFPRVIKDKYDFIDLSNILDYYHYRNDNSPLKFFKTVKQLYNNNLKENGYIRVSSCFKKHYSFDSKDLKCLKEKYGENKIQVLQDTGLFGVNDSIILRKSANTNPYKDNKLFSTYERYSL